MPHLFRVDCSPSALYQVLIDSITLIEGFERRFKPPANMIELIWHCTFEFASVNSKNREQVTALRHQDIRMNGRLNRNQRVEFTGVIVLAMKSFEVDHLVFLSMGMR